jgi:PAS domain S-box-containing protein
MCSATKPASGFGYAIVAPILLLLAVMLAVSGPYEASRGIGPWAATGACFLLIAHTPKHWRILAATLLALVLTISLFGFGTPLSGSVLSGVTMAGTGLLLALAMSPIPDRRLTNLRSLGRFTGIAIVFSIVTGGIATGYAALTPHTLGSSFLPVTVSTLASILLLGPTILTRLAKGLAPKPAEVAAQAVLVCLALLAAFALPGTEPTHWLPIPLLIWASVRFGEMIVSAELAVIYLSTVFLNSTAQIGINHHWFAELYLIMAFSITMPIALATQERADALRDLRMTSRVFQNSFRNSQMPIALVRWIKGELIFDEVNAAGQRLLADAQQPLAGSPVQNSIILPDEIATAVDSIISGSQQGWEGRSRLVGEVDSDLSVILSPLDTRGPTPQLSLTIHDLTAEARIRAQLEEERLYNAAVLGSSPSVILVTKPDGTIVSCNRAGCDIVGYDEAEMIGRKYYELVAPPELREELKSAFRNRAHPAAEGAETVILTRSGERRLLAYRQADFISKSSGEELEVYTALDITEQRQISQLSQQLVDSATTVAFIGTDRDGKVTLFNTGAETLLGHDANSVIGTDFTQFLSPAALAGYAAKNDPGFADVVSRVTHEGIPETRDWTWLRASGAALRVSMTTSVVTDPFGHRPTGYLFVARDVSDSRRSQEIVVLALKREREAVNRLRTLDRVKDEFISTISHELRTPMTSIIGTTELLEDEMGGPLTDGQRGMLDIISRNGERLLTLADDLLLTAKLHSSNETQQEDLIDLRDVARECLDSLGMTLSGRNINLQSDLPPTAVTVNASHFHLERAISNLLSNAIKFTLDEGNVSLELTQTNSEAILQISDDGIGIPSEDLENVFDRFYRSPNVDEHAIQGTGLGLSIVKAIVESHRGSIALTSEVNHGTTVRLTFPLANAVVPIQPSGK